MIEEKILFLTVSDCGIPTLKNHQLGIGPTADFDLFYVRPLKKVFSEVIVYDLWKSYAEVGVSKANAAVLEVVRLERPKYLLWPSMMYEAKESTFHAVRQQGTSVVGWFFDDEVRFDHYSRWWIPYLDSCITHDEESVRRYEELGLPAEYVVSASDPETFRKLNLPKRYDVTFIGRRFGDRSIWVEQLGKTGMDVRAFGRGWSSDFVSTEEMVKIFNVSKINLCFVQSYGANTKPQLKDRIFNVCMSGGFLLCEYMPGIEKYFEIGKEIVCFQDLEDATVKIRYYLDHEAERQAIAEAGFERAQRDHTQASRLRNVFEIIERNWMVKNRGIDCAMQLSTPKRVRRHPSLYHFMWAMGLMAEKFPRERWQEELDLALYYDPDNVRARLLRMIGRCPGSIPAELVHSWIALAKFKHKMLS